MKLYNKLLAAGVLLSIPALALTSCGKNDTRSYMTVEINPGVEFVLDTNNKVITANGLNDDGETLISNVKFEGLTYEAALEVVVKEAEESGYLITASSESLLAKKDISISISSTDDKLQVDLEAKIESKVKDLIDKEKIQAEYKKLEAKARKELEKIALEYDPTLTQEQLDKLTQEQLYNYVELATIEKAEIASKALEDYYFAFKEYQFTLKYKDELVKSLDKMTGIAVEALRGLSGELDKAVKAINDLQYELFVNPESNYLKALAELEALKDKVISLEFKITNAEGEELVSLKAELKASKEAIETLKGTIEGIMNTFNTTLDGLKKVLNTVKAGVDSAATKLEGLDYNKMLTNVEKSVNDYKSKVLDEFEKEFADEYKAAKEKVAKRKEALEQAVKVS